MSESAARPAIEKIRQLVVDQASGEHHLPQGLAERILEHEHAVQFDEKRFEASGYIRSLVHEALDREQGPS